jgi:hypothetical protein
MLFLLVMEVLNGLLRKADEWHFLRTFGVCPIAHCALLYADDMVIFISQEAQDLAMLCLILDLFEGSSDLGCNMVKCSMVAIRCFKDQIADSMKELTADSMSCFPCELVPFLIRYFEIPLSVSKLPRAALQPLLDKVADRLPLWKGRLLHRSGRLALIKSMLTAIHVYDEVWYQGYHISWTQWKGIGGGGAP